MEQRHPERKTTKRLTSRGADTSDLLGLVVGGRYRIVSLLGEGGMGTVYRTEQLSLRRIVALKVLSTGPSDSDVLRERFLREARAASLLHHANVVDIIDFGEMPDGRAYFVMEFIEGESLDELLKRVGPLTWPQITEVAQQIMSALAAAHTKGIVHRDVKPANCIVVSTEEDSPIVKVIDFGIAKVHELGSEASRDLTQTGEVFGTPAYMSPEQARGEAVDGRADIYSVGILMYELATGLVPFRGGTTMQLLARVLFEQPKPPRAANPRADLSDAAEALILRALAKRPAQRFASMQAFAQAMLSLPESHVPDVSSAGSSLPSRTTIPEMIRPPPTASGGVGRRTAWIAGALAAVAGAAIGLAVMVTRGDRRSAPMPASVAGSEEPARLPGRPSPSPASPQLRPGSAASSLDLAPADLRPRQAPAPAIDPLPVTERQSDSKDVDRPPSRVATNGKKRAAPRAASVPALTPATDDKTVVHAPMLTDATIDEAIERERPRLLECARKHGGLAGMEVEVQFAISKESGKVIRSRAIGARAGTKLGACVAQAVGDVRFPKGAFRNLRRTIRL